MQLYADTLVDLQAVNNRSKKPDNLICFTCLPACFNLRLTGPQLLLHKLIRLQDLLQRKEMLARQCPSKALAIVAHRIYTADRGTIRPPGRPR
jgi:hypothetical protein